MVDLAQVASLDSLESFDAVSKTQTLGLVSSDDEAAKQEHPVWRLSFVALPMLSLCTTWAVLLPNSTPYMLSLGLSPSLATLNNLAGPVTGFVVAPLVGSWSDSLRSPYGRRRPIILAGMAATWISATLFGCSAFLPEDRAVSLAMPMLWVLDAAITVLLGPQRALIADMATEAQQVQMQIMFSILQAIGLFLGFFIQRFCDVATEHMLELLVFCCVLNTVFVGVQCALARETPLRRAPEGDARCSVWSLITASCRGLREGPVLLKQIAGVQILVWMAVTSWISFAGQWFSVSVYRGDVAAPSGSPGRAAYVSGQGLFSLAGQCRSVMHLISAMLIMWILRKTSVPPRVVYAASIAVGSLANYTAAFVVGQNGTLALICASVATVPYVASLSIPYGLVARMNCLAEKRGENSNVGLHVAVIGCCNNIGQQIATAILAGMEEGVPLASALPLTFAVGAVAETLGWMGALALNDQVDRDD